MCSIIGIHGSCISNEIIRMLKVLNHRGPDAFGIYFDNKVYYNEDINEDVLNGHDFYLAHNLLSIVGNNEVQPIKSENLVLVSNAEIYNYNYLVEKYDLCNFKTESDCEVILKLIEYHYKDNLKDAVLKSIDEIDGDYAFCVSDADNYMVVRDHMGVKPVYYSSNEKYFAFASEAKALKQIDLNNIENLKPTHAIYNDEIIKIRDEYNRKPASYDYNTFKEQLKQLLIKSVEKRVHNLDEVALLFSAGVDSTLIAIILKKLGIKTTLYTVGTQNSQDLTIAKKIAHDIDLPLKYNIINQEDVENHFITTINMIEDTNLMKIGVAMTVNLSSKLASDDNHNVILSGQGADELFAGYNRYKNKIETPDELLDELTHDINQMYEVNLERDDKATMNNSIELRVPYLDNDFVELALQIPVDYLIKSTEDIIRKHILRDVAYELGVPEEIAYRPKKAAQYGTGIDKIIRKKIIKQEKYANLLNK